MTGTTPSALVTGNSSGLGYGLTGALLERGWRVHGVSRRGCDLDGNLVDVRGDLSDFDAIPDLLSRLLHDAGALDLVVLNAGVLGGIRLMHDTSLDEVKRVMLRRFEMVLDTKMHRGALSPSELQAVKELMSTRYGSREWNLMK